MEILESGKKNIVILGAGFGGITALLKLRSALARQKLLGFYNLVLINNRSYHLYTPALYEIASLPRGDAAALPLKSAICIPIADILERFGGVGFIGEEVQKLDPRTHVITFRSGNQISFEYVIIALGAETNFFDVPGLAEHSFPLKTFEDAVYFRNKAEEIAAGKKDVIRAIVGGGGPAGVEFSAELTNFFCRLKEKRTIGQCRAEIILMDSRSEILSGFSASVIRKSRRRLKKLGVKVMTLSTIKRVTASEAALEGGHAVRYDLLIWSGGVKPASVLKNFGLTLDNNGAVVVNKMLEARPQIYAIGDCASFINPRTGRPLPRNVPVAEASAGLAAANILANIMRRKPQEFALARIYPYILAVGGKYALTDLVIVRFSGFLGWLLKQVVELRYLISILPARKAAAMWLRAVYYSSAND